MIDTGTKVIDDILNGCLKIFATKGIDYSLGSNDRLHNFKTVAAFMRTHAKTGFGRLSL
jgi:hypothetical protein